MCADGILGNPEKNGTTTPSHPSFISCQGSWLAEREARAGVARKEPLLKHSRCTRPAQARVGSLPRARAHAPLYHPLTPRPRPRPRRRWRPPTAMSSARPSAASTSRAAAVRRTQSSSSTGAFSAPAPRRIPPIEAATASTSPCPWGLRAAPPRLFAATHSPRARAPPDAALDIRPRRLAPRPDGRCC